MKLTDTELTEEQKSLLNLGPNFVPATKKYRLWTLFTFGHMRNTCVISRILNRNSNTGLRDNLSKSQRKALVKIKNNKDTKLYPFEKGSGFAVLPEKKATQKIEE